MSDEQVTKDTKQDIEDTKWGTKFCYCSQHIRVHGTGWCSVAARQKIPLHADTLEEAEKEFARIKLLVEGKWWLAN